MQGTERMEERLVKMGDLATSVAGGESLVTVGLGSCVGVALVDGRVAGLAHVVLPESNGHGGGPGKYGDLAVPALLEALAAAGAKRSRLEAVVVGGAHMFPVAQADGDFDIGGRNAAVIGDELARLGIPVRATAIGGAKGRTVRVFPDGGIVVAKEAGGREFEL